MNYLNFIILSFSILLFACTQSKNVVIPKDMTKWETDLMPSVQKLTEDEKKVLTAFLIRAKMAEAFGGASLKEGTTIKDAIQIQLAWQKQEEIKLLEENKLKEKLQAEANALKKQVEELLTVTIVELKLVKEDFQTKQLINLGFHNKGTKDIVGIKGKLYFIDMFDNEVGSVAFSFTDGVKAGGTAIWKGARDYNQFIPEHRAVANVEEGKYKTKFVADMIIFKDGTKIKMPE